MGDVAVAIPWEGGCPHRERALDWVKPRLEALGWPVTLIDQTPEFAKSRAVNAAADRLDAEILVVCDADCWAEGIPEAVEAVRDGAAWAMPHLYVHRLTEDSTAKLIAGADPVGLPLVEPRYKGAKGGGIFVVRRDVLVDVPWDERYRGWGRQDLSWRAAMTTIHGDPVRGRNDLWHLWHPPMERRGRNQSASDLSEALYARYKAARFDEPAIRKLLAGARVVEPQGPTRVLICAAGSQERWKESGGKGRKQLIQLDGEPIIRRLHRLVCERVPAEDVITLVREPDHPDWEGLNPQAPAHEDWMGDLGKFLDGKPYWPERGRVVILYGDAYYTEATVAAILDHWPDQPTIYGRAQQRRSESFGFAFRVPEDVEEVERVCRKVCQHPSMIKRGGPWRFFWVRHNPHATRYRKAVERKKLTAIATPENGWIEVGHDETDDFDHLRDLNAWKQARRRAA